MRVIKPTSWGSEEARYLRRAVEQWVHRLGERAFRPLAHWKEGLGAVPLLPPSSTPSLEFGDKKEMDIHAISI